MTKLMYFIALSFFSISGAYAGDEGAFIDCRTNTTKAGIPMLIIYGYSDIGASFPSKPILFKSYADRLKSEKYCEEVSKSLVIKKIEKDEELVDLGMGRYAGGHSSYYSVINTHTQTTLLSGQNYNDLVKTEVSQIISIIEANASGLVKKSI